MVWTVRCGTTIPSRTRSKSSTSLRVNRAIWPPSRRKSRKAARCEDALPSGRTALDPLIPGEKPVPVDALAPTPCEAWHPGIDIEDESTMVVEDYKFFEDVMNEITARSSMPGAGVSSPLPRSRRMGRRGTLLERLRLRHPMDQPQPNG